MNGHGAGDLVEFLRRCLAEDEQTIIKASGDYLYGDGHGDAVYRWFERWSPIEPGPMLADVDIKRRILARHADCGLGHGYCDDGGKGWELDDGTPMCADKLDLAQSFAGREGWREEWRLR